MKISLNLSYAESLHERYALAWAIPATMLGLAGAVLLGVYTVRAFHEYREVRRQATEVEQRGDLLHLQEANLRKEWESPQHRELLTKARFVNTLIEQKQLSLTGLAAQLTDLLPEDARLTGLTLTSKGEEYTLRMAVTGKSEEAVETFLGGLEDAPDFKDVTMVNEGFQEESATPGEVRIVCAARYLPGAE